MLAGATADALYISGTSVQGFNFDGTIKRGAAASKTVVESNANPIGTPTWTVTATADTTNGALKFTVTGVAATNISWAVTIATSELTS